jgi:putative serine protease PepD
MAWLSATLVAGPAGAGEDLDQLLTQISDRVSESVVAVHAVRSLPAESGEARGRCLGTGVMLADGYVATTLSVAGPGDEITLRYGDGHTSPAAVVGVSPLRELVLLEPEERRGPGLPYGSADSLHAGSWVFVVGYSMNSPEPMLASGRFSIRTILTLNDSSPDTIELLQLEANVFPGNSGAAVIDSEGRFVGIILGGLGRDGFLDPVVLSSFDDELPLTHCIMTAQPPLGISFALPATDVESLALAARTGTLDRPGYLGIRVDVSDGGSAPGVRVSEVVSGSPAANAGVRAGDVIHGLNGTATDDPMTLVALVRELRPGSIADLMLGPSSDPSARRANVTLGDYTTDYRTPLVWHRLLSGRAASLADARARLVERLSVLDSELRHLEALTPFASSETR